MDIQTLQILEYCDKRDWKRTILYWLIRTLKVAGSRFGIKHSGDTRQKMSLSQKGHPGSINHP